jgi:choline-sulfatase
VSARCRFALLLIALLSACGREAPAPVEVPEGPPSILLVTLDTTRADRIGAYGYGDGQTPHVDRLAREGVLFEQAIAPTPITLPSHVSILTGVGPSEHGVRDNAFFSLSPDALLVSEVLLRRGWRTAAFVGSYILAPQFGLAQGFERYGAPLEGDSLVRSDRSANLVTGEAIDWLSRLSPDERFFLWVHFYDPHAPLHPPPPWNTRLKDPYDAEIAFCDDQLGRLLEAIAAKGLDRNLLTVVTADHGEALGEHHEATHGVLLYQSTMHVPLIFHGPLLGSARGTRVARRVSTMDLPATLLHLAGIPADALPASRSAPLLEPGRLPDAASSPQPIYLESLLPFHSLHWRALRGLVSDDYKLIEGSQPELYQLDDDPGERSDLAEREPARVQDMERQLEQIVSRPPLGWGRQRGASAEEAERLAALGYVVGTSDGDPFAADLPDPNDRVQDVLSYVRAERLLLRGVRLLPDDPVELAGVEPAKQQRGLDGLREARVLLAALYERDPGNPYLAYRLGIAESKLGNHAAALPLLELARLHHPDARLHFRLGLAYEAAGRRGDARREVRAAQSSDPEALYVRWLDQHPDSD